MMESRPSGGGVLLFVAALFGPPILALAGILFVALPYAGSCYDSCDRQSAVIITNLSAQALATLVSWTSLYVLRNRPDQQGRVQAGVLAFSLLGFVVAWGIAAT